MAPHNRYKIIRLNNKEKMEDRKETRNIKRYRGRYSLGFLSVLGWHYGRVKRKMTTWENQKSKCVLSSQ